MKTQIRHYDDLREALLCGWSMVGLNTIAAPAPSTVQMRLNQRTLQAARRREMLVWRNGLPVSNIPVNPPTNPHSVFDAAYWSHK